MILIPEDISEKGKNYLKEKGYRLKIGGGTSERELICNVADADAILVRNAVYTRNVMEAGKRLKVIARHGTGIDNIDVKAAEELGIWVVNGPLANINAVAEHTIACIAALSAQLLISDQRTRAGDWTFRTNLRRYDMKDKILGLVGFGRIGSCVAAKAVYGLGMQVYAYDPGIGDRILPEGVSRADTMEELLACADFLSLHVPSTPETRGLINGEVIDRMKPGAYIINCARGDICVETDLCRALNEKRIAGAALDVFEEEPLNNSELLALENVILTQHHAGITQDSLDRMGYDAALGINDILSGRMPAWPVNRPVNGRAGALKSRKETERQNERI